VNMWDWINGLFNAIGLPPVERALPYAGAYALGAACEAVFTLLPWLGEPRLTRAVAAVCAKDHYFDIAAAQRDLHLSSPIGMDEAHRRFAACFGQAHTSSKDAPCALARPY